MNKMTEISMVEQKEQYGQYLVAFIDILGFSDIVEKSSEDSQHYRQILESLKQIEHFVIYNEGKKEREGSQVKMTQFSDSLVISRPFIDRDSTALFAMISNLDLIQKVLAGLGVMVRGGLTSGKLYHEGNLAFGPAFIDAYVLESKKAIYPRIVIDPSLLDENGLEIVEKTLQYTLKKNLLKQDIDGYYFVNFLGGSFSKSDATDAKILERTIPNQLLSLTDDDNKTIRIREKLEWMMDYISQCKKTIH